MNMVSRENGSRQMVIDSSALLAILLGEADADTFIDALAESPRRYLSAVNLLETAIVIEARKGRAGGREMDVLLHSRANSGRELHRGTRRDGKTSVAPMGQGKSRGGVEFMRLLRLRPGAGNGRAALIQGQRFPAELTFKRPSDRTHRETPVHGTTRTASPIPRDPDVPCRSPVRAPRGRSSPRAC